MSAVGQRGHRPRAARDPRGDAVPVSRGLRLHRRAAPPASRGARSTPRTPARRARPSRSCTPALPRRRAAHPIEIRAPARCPASRSPTTPCGAKLGFDLWLRSHGVDERSAADAAAGWGGDRAVVLARPGDRHPATPSPGPQRVGHRGRRHRGLRAAGKRCLRRWSAASSTARRLGSRCSPSTARILARAPGPSLIIVLGAPPWSAAALATEAWTRPRSRSCRRRSDRRVVGPALRAPLSSTCIPPWVRGSTDHMLRTLRITNFRGCVSRDVRARARQPARWHEQLRQDVGLLEAIHMLSAASNSASCAASPTSAWRDGRHCIRARRRCCASVLRACVVDPHPLYGRRHDRRCSPTLIASFVSREQTDHRSSDDANASDGVN